MVLDVVLDGYIGLNRTQYAYDIVLLRPTATAMSTLLTLCDAFASKFDVKLNEQKSKLLVRVCQAVVANGHFFR